VAELVDLAAHRAGLQRIDKRNIPAAPPVLPVPAVEAIQADSAAET